MVVHTWKPSAKKADPGALRAAGELGYPPKTKGQGTGEMAQAVNHLLHRPGDLSSNFITK